MNNIALSNEDSGVRALPKASRKRSKKAAPAPVAKERSVLPAIGGALLGCFVPLAAHTIVNAPEFRTAPHLLWTVVACLAYSAPTVCAWASEFTTAGAKHWASHALGWLKAFGFVGCLEGILVGAPASCSWLGWIALAMLMGINSAILAVKFGKKVRGRA